MKASERNVSTFIGKPKRKHQKNLIFSHIFAENAIEKRQ